MHMYAIFISIHVTLTAMNDFATILCKIRARADTGLGMIGTSRFLSWVLSNIIHTLIGSMSHWFNGSSLRHHCDTALQQVSWVVHIYKSTNIEESNTRSRVNCRASIDCSIPHG